MGQKVLLISTGMHYDQVGAASFSATFLRDATLQNTNKSTFKNKKKIKIILKISKKKKKKTKITSLVIVLNSQHP